MAKTLLYLVKDLDICSLENALGIRVSLDAKKLDERDAFAHEVDSTFQINDIVFSVLLKCIQSFPYQLATRPQFYDLC